MDDFRGLILLQHVMKVLEVQDDLCLTDQSLV